MICMATCMARWTFAIVVLAGSGLGWAQMPRSYGVRTDGSVVRELAPAGAKAVVLYFVASDCPVSNRTMPEMLRVRQEFVGRGVGFWFVYANTGETAGSVRRHQAGFGAGADVLMDRAGRLVEMTHVRVTPEAAVLVREGAGWKAVYAGRVDDRYVRLGVERPQATEHYVEQVVREVLEGGPVQAAMGVPVGVRDCEPEGSADGG